MQQATGQIGHLRRYGDMVKGAEPVSTMATPFRWPAFLRGAGNSGATRYGCVNYVLDDQSMALRGIDC